MPHIKISNNLHKFLCYVFALLPNLPPIHTLPMTPVPHYSSTPLSSHSSRASDPFSSGSFIAANNALLMTTNVNHVNNNKGAVGNGAPPIVSKVAMEDSRRWESGVVVREKGREGIGERKKRPRSQRAKEAEGEAGEEQK
ncbi:hypothetical protein HNY73_000469 [Argiope bruennichi]|uniref:Uncharacterized protein n=1 Tax=Argiope bruennichi TaxID=94029 RepID=A0A8T0FZ57_ARGBR|nr:hypothetical protein HNY73_000469 [Argiope bruennichi]